MRKTHAFATALAATAALATAGPAGALAPLPTGNLISGGDEEQFVSATGNDIFPLANWVRLPLEAQVATVRYGAPGFPTIAQAAEMGAGAMLFAGGPSAAGDDNSVAFTDSEIYQTVQLPADALPYVKAGGVQITVSACLGGYADQSDFVNVFGGPSDYATVHARTNLVLFGPSARERHGETKLLPRSSTMRLPPDATIYTVIVKFSRESGKGTYSDGYADKIEAHLSPVSSDPPKANCTAPTPQGAPSAPGGEPSGSSTGPGNTADSSATNTAVPLAQAAKRVVLTKRYALLKLRCVAHDEACRGAVTLRTKAARLGSARFEIATGSTPTIKVKLTTKARRMLARLSTRRVAKLQIAATAAIGTQRTTFTLGATR
jgi:hypothetical protein